MKPTTIYQKESVMLEMEVLDTNNNVPDLTNAEFRFRIRRKFDGDGTPALFEKVCVLSLPNTVMLHLSETDTELPCGFYVQEWRCFDQLTGEVITVHQSELSIRESLFDEALN